MPSLTNRRLTQKQETFCLKYFELRNATEAARLAGYSARSVRFIASENLTKLNIQQRLDELNQVAQDATIATVIERKQILTEIARGRLADFVTVGKDGAWFNIGKETMNSRALALATSKTIVGKDGADDAVIIRVGLHNPIPAIAELNKMEKIYEAEGRVIIDNRTLTINVISDKAKDLTKRLVEGERTGGDNDH